MTCKAYSENKDNDGNILRIERMIKNEINAELKRNKDLTNNIHDEIEEIMRDDEPKQKKLTHKQEKIMRMEIEKGWMKTREDAKMEALKISRLNNEIQKRAIAKKLLEKYQEENDNEESEENDSEENDSEEETPRLRTPKNQKIKKYKKELEEENDELKDKVYKLEKMMEKLMKKLDDTKKKKKKGDKLYRSVSNLTIKED